MFEDLENVLTVEEVCEAMKMGRDAVYGLLQTGELKAMRNGRVWRIPREALIDYVCRHCGLSYHSHY